MNKPRMSVEEVRRRYLLPDLPVRHTRFSPVMLIGQHRSGTTILGTLLRKYLKVNFGPESQFFVRKLKEIDRYGDLDDDRNLRSLVVDLAAERCFRLNQFGFSVDIDGTLARIEERSLAGVIDTIFSDFARHNGMERWGDKTPEYVLDLAVLKELFPDAQFVHIVRDGRDVALSNFEVFFGAKNSVVAAIEWKSYIDKVREFSLSLEENQFLEIRYEDLMQDPPATFQTLSRFLQIDDPDGSLQAFLESELPAELKTGNFNKWRLKMSVEQQQQFESVAARELADHGYELAFPAIRPIGFLARQYWYVDHYFRKCLRAGAWKDNYYKLGLRLRAVGARIGRRGAPK